MLATDAPVNATGEIGIVSDIQVLNTLGAHRLARPSGVTHPCARAFQMTVAADAVRETALRTDAHAANRPCDLTLRL